MRSKSFPSDSKMRQIKVNSTVLAALSTPACGPCVMAANDNLEMYDKYDLHIIDNKKFEEDRNFYKPPPGRLTLLATGFFCYCYTLSWHARVLKRKKEEGEILFDWESSNRPARALEGCNVPIRKVVILGAPGVGKSGVFTRLCGGGFPEAVSLVQGEDGDGERSVEIGGRYRDKNVNVGARMIAMEGEGGEGVIEFWDVPPDCQASNVNVTSGKALEGADLILLIFDVRHKKTFLNMSNAVEEVKVRAHEDGKAHPPPFMVLGNFCDTLQTEDKEFRFKRDVEAFCRKNAGGGFQLVSARTGEGIVCALKEIYLKSKKSSEGTGGDMERS
mmetsp:Transcript_1723/g.3289  ORF Transcript_1723/g.3289 Transcript_1723/m.3289 type:complete len:331 (+) Transcript_1723:2715-3707(+)